MPSEVAYYRNPVFAIRDYLRAHLTESTGGVYKGAPVGVAYPYVELRRVGGSPNADSTPTDQPLIQFDVYGALDDDPAAEALAYRLIAVLHAMTCGLDLGNNLTFLSATVTLGPLDFPDPANNRPRYIVDCRFEVIARS